MAGFEGEKVIQRYDALSFFSLYTVAIESLDVSRQWKIVPVMPFKFGTDAVRSVT